MECRDVMRSIETRLYADEPAAKAIDFMARTHMGLVPVVDREDRFVGLVSGDRLMHLMLPHAVTMMRGEKRIGYLRESRAELRERLDAVRGRTIADVMEQRVETVRPETGLVEAMLLMSNRQYVVPVVDADGALAGAISFFSVLKALGLDGEDRS